MFGGYRAISKVDGWGEVPKRDDLPRYNKTFCRNMAAAFHIDVVAVEPIPETHGLWAANHVSWMDIPVMGSVVPAFFLSKAEVESMPAFGRLARACGSLFIKRGSGDSGKVSGQITEFLKKGYSIIFYPEGTTTDGSHIKKIYATEAEQIELHDKIRCCANEFVRYIHEHRPDVVHASLTDAMECMGISWEGIAHTSIADTIACRAVWESLFPNYYKD